METAHVISVSAVEHHTAESFGTLAGVLDGALVWHSPVSRTIESVPVGVAPVRVPGSRAERGGGSS
jgi:hypothetical protein